LPRFGYLQEARPRLHRHRLRRYQRFFKDIQRFFAGLGYHEDKMVSPFGEHRVLFHDPVYERHIDIFFDQLHFSHTLPLAGRLEAESLTLPLAELFLEKAQIVQINEKDVVDTVMLLREHPVGEGDDETINARIITRLTSTDWGLWRTVTGNLALLRERLPRYAQLTDEDRGVVAERIDHLQRRIDDAPKTTRWKIRSAIGERVKWYEDVEDLAGR
jgi:hypothetical protein